MKILMLTPFFYPHTGGTEKYVKDLSTELVKKGHEVTVISNNVPRSKNAPAEEMMNGFKVIRLPAIDVAYCPVTASFRREMCEGFDIVHCHAPAVSFVRAVAGKIKAPVMVTFHCDVLMFDKFIGVPIPGFLKSAFNSLMSAHAKFFVKRADGVLATSESYAAGSPVLRSVPHYVAPIGVHYENFDPIIEKLKISEKTKNKNQIVFVGRLAANKGVDYLIRAIPLIIRKFPKLKVLICGEGEEKPHLESLIKRFGVADNVEFHGVLTLEKLVEYYSNSICFVLPSINSLEAFGIVQLEAMACRTAVVASNIRGVNSVIDQGKAGYIAEPFDPKDLAEKIMKVLSDPKAAIEMGKYGRKMCEDKYNWDVITDRIIGFYQEMIEKKK
ncbi:MAG: glycosyltransferase family 4 protein [Candidatus Saganbacteria bacterium]|nr:glycosyltransferase family 4 protein [Candidatus Saganbacteria bacterium]